MGDPWDECPGSTAAPTLFGGAARTDDEDIDENPSPDCEFFHTVAGRRTRGPSLIDTWTHDRVSEHIDIALKLPAAIDATCMLAESDRTVELRTLPSELAAANSARLVGPDEIRASRSVSAAQLCWILVRTPAGNCGTEAPARCLALVGS